jgi:hypothetical protein
MRTFLQPKKLLPILVLLPAFIMNAQKSVLTQHNDLNRTGWYDNETILNKNNVRQGSFGKIFVRPVDDQIYAQPLVKVNLTSPPFGEKNIVFVATVNYTIYAFDADSGAVCTAYWQVNLTPVQSRVINKNDETGACGGFYNDFSGNMGIVGTPVIDSATNTMYVVARSIDINGSANSAKQYLHALDITTGAERTGSPVLIAATISGSGDGSSGGTVSFNALHQNQRSGLLLLNGVIYIAWSSHCDWGPYHGWLMGYDKTSLQQKYVYNSTPDGYNGGIWMSGGGPSADSAGNIYLAVGNGSVGKNGNPSDTRNRSETALKLSPSGNGFSIQSFFTPRNYETLEGADLDFGVTQLMLIPGTKRAIVGVKDGHIYLLDRDNLGGYSSVADNVAQTIDLGSNSFLRSAMSYFKGSKKYIYSWSENSLLRAYPYNAISNLIDLNNTVVSGLQGPTGNSGAMLSVSSNGSIDSTGILWASYAANGDANQSVRPGILRASDATDVTKELWNSSMHPNDNPGNYAKFNCPTIANGKVYLGTFSNQLIVYGLTGIFADTCNSTNIAFNKLTYASSAEGTDYSASYATDGNLNTGWSSQFSDPQYIYVDLGTSYNLCRIVLHWEVAYGKDFKVQVSDDASVWTDIASITNNPTRDNYIPVKATGRYVRIYGTQRGTAYGYSLWEFEVYGKPTAVNCTAPTNLYTADVYQTTATLHWSATGASNYIVQYKTVAAVNWIQTMATSNTITLNNVSCNTPYLYRVQAFCNNTDSSGFSVSGGFTTLPCDINCDPLPTRWSTQDIGNTGVVGSACYNSSIATFELKGSGADIGSNQDAFRFAYKTIVGDGEITVRVTDQDNVNAKNKCGIMVRESLAEGSKYAFVCLTNGNSIIFQTRSTTDSLSSSEHSQLGIATPYWLKLIITGSTYTGYMSPDGLTWKQVGSPVNANFGNGLPVYAGLAITSHDNTVLSTAHIDNFSTGGISYLKLISFTGSLSLNQTVALNWITTLETRTNYFVVERTKDNMYYQSIDTVYALNNGEFTQNYDATDFTPNPGINYYRLKIVDLDGSITYSPIVAVRVTNEKAPLMFPNPSNTYVNITPGTDLIKYINVYNILGKTVLKIPNTNSQGIIQIPTYSFSNGIYVIEIRTTNAVYREKLIVHN